MRHCNFKLNYVGENHGIKFICINASQLSAFCDRHRYKDQKEAFLDVIQNASNKHILGKIDTLLDKEDLLYKPILKKLGINPQDNQSITKCANEIINRQDEIGEKARELVKNAAPVTKEDTERLRIERPNTSEITKTIVTNLRTNVTEIKEAQISSILTKEVVKKADVATTLSISKLCSEKKLDEKSTKILEEKLKSTWVKDRGTIHENTVFNSLKNECPSDMTSHSQANEVLRISVGNIHVLIPCFTDCIYKSDQKYEKVFEIKNRKSHFFLPQYDLDQLCLYVMAFNANEGILVERCQNQTQKSYFMSKEEAQKRLQIQIFPDFLKAVEKFVHAVTNPRDNEYYKIWNSLRLSLK
jgi:hypothetical protein